MVRVAARETASAAEAERAAVAAAEAAREQAAREAAEAARVAEVAGRKTRVKDIKTKLQRSRVRCTCRLPFHTEKCAIRCRRSQELWPGADVGITRSDLEFYHGFR